MLRPVCHSRRRWIGAAAALPVLVALAACGEVTEPKAVLASLQISPSTDLTLEVGETASLGVILEDSDGDPVEGQSANWSTSSPGVATVNGTGLVTAVGPGQSKITAFVAAFRDSVMVTVLEPPPASGCDDSSEPWALGEVRHLAPNAAGAVCILGGNSSFDYALVLTNTATAGSLSLRVSGTGMASTLPLLNIGTRGAAFPIGQEDRLRRDWSTEATIRAREGRDLLDLVTAARGAGAADLGSGPRFAITKGVPAVGSLMTLNASLEACTNQDNRVGRVMAVSQTAVIVADTMNPDGGFSSADYERIATTIDTLVSPVVEGAFGEPTDIDENGRVVVFYTRAVNELTEDEDSFVGGFFYARDLFPTTTSGGLGGCAGSNVGELVYLLVPDPDGDVNNNVRTKDFVERITIETIGHELQHLISASRRLHIMKVQAFSEELWLNEGLSHVAEELLFYRASGLSPGQNISSTNLQGSQRVRDAFNRFSASNFGRLGDYLEDPSGNSPYDSADELGMRGSAWAFLRYAADRRGGNQQEFWFDLVNSSNTGVTNLADVLGTDPLPWIRDWTMAVYSDDLTSDVAVPYLQPSWNFRSVYTVLTSFDGGYPLSTRSLTSAGSNFSLQAGGGAFFPFSVSSGGEVEVSILTGGSLPPATLQITVLRSK